MSTNYQEHYLDWVRDAFAMEKQAESMLEKMAGRLEHYPDLKARIEQHIVETRQQQDMIPFCAQRRHGQNGRDGPGHGRNAGRR